jgi:lipoprotein-anchoring transpeptidase ErfK/SrfK
MRRARRRPSPARRGSARRGGAGAIRLLPLIAALVVSGCGATRHAAPPPATTQPTHHRAAPKPHAHESIVASALTKNVPIYRSPSARRPFLHLANPNKVGEPLVFLVKRRGNGWEQVYLPIRPDGSTGWINDRDLSLAWNPYSLEVRRSAHQLVLRKSERVLARFPAAVGRTALPTPRGRYYIVELLKQPDPNGVYGPYAFGLSAYSNVLFSFGGGPGEIGLHGTNEPWALGTSVSHGCIRISNAGIAKLAAILPLGTPVEIVK